MSRWSLCPSLQLSIFSSSMQLYWRVLFNTIFCRRSCVRAFLSKLQATKLIAATTGALSESHFQQIIRLLIRPFKCVSDVTMSVHYCLPRFKARSERLNVVLGPLNQTSNSVSSSSSSFNFKAHEKSKSIQIKAGTTRQETALTVALKININTSIKHQTVNKAYNIRKTQQQK